MKKYINRKLYDTDRAKKIGSVEDNIADRLFYTIKTLYKKKTNEYFLHCEGGAGTPYAEPDAGGGMTDGELITPLSYENAQKWAEENLSADIYETEFGAPEEGTHRLITDISLVEKAKLEEYARNNNLISMSAAIRKLINEVSI